jgi:hypothetical protein
MAKSTQRRKNLEALERKELQELEKLDKTVGEVNKRLKKLTSLRFRLLNAIFQGFGVVLGGTIVTWIVITILVEVLQKVNYIPLIHTLFESEPMRVFIERLSNLQEQL